MKTYLRLASDLHLEAWTTPDFASLARKFLPHDARDATSILVLAGDISSKPEQLVGFLNTVADRFMTVIFVPGNHEYYRHDFDEWNANLKASALKPNIIFCTDDVVEHQIPGFRFLLTTLWGDGGKDHIERTWVDRGLNDFRLIRQNGTRFSVMEMIAVHKQQKAALENCLKHPFNGKTIVVTHHLPSYRLCHPRFGTDVNGGFAANCDDILAYDHAPWLWIHGHTHDRVSTKLWKTMIECNPAGYSGEWSTGYNTFHEVPVFIELPDG